MSHVIAPHWNYLLAIERDLEQLSRYIEFDSKNFHCFSIEIARLLLASAAEVDVVCKQLCLKLSGQSKANNIRKYRTEITGAYKNIMTFNVEIPRFGLTFTPWAEWEKTNEDPEWWIGYNKIKHHRHSEYERANLKNALNAVCGLFVMVLYLYREKAECAELFPALTLLRADRAHIIQTTYGEYGFGINYFLGP